jgi:hypothetical protein
MNDTAALAWVRQHANLAISDLDDTALKALIASRYGYVKRLLMRPLMASGAGAARVLLYTLAPEFVDADAAGYRLETADGAVIDTALIAVDAAARTLTLSDPTAAQPDTLPIWATFQTLDGYGAVGDVFMWRLGQLAESLYDVKTDNHDLKRSQLRDVYMRQAESYYARSSMPRGGAGSTGQSVRLVRDDLEVWL